MRWPPGCSMRDSLKDTDYIGYDETLYPIMGKSGWAWVAASHDTISCCLAASRSRATFEEHVMVPGRPATVDRYAVYRSLDVTQRCWAHILRDTTAESRAVEKAGMELTDSRNARILLERLKYLTKKGPRGDHTTHVGQALEISKQYTTKHWPRRRRTCSRSYCTIWSPQTTTPRGPCALWWATAMSACRYAACAACGGAIRCGRASVRGGCAAPRYTVSCGSALPREP